MAGCSLLEVVCRSSRVRPARPVSVNDDVDGMRSVEFYSNAILCAGSFCLDIITEWWITGSLLKRAEFLLLFSAVGEERVKNSLCVRDLFFQRILLRLKETVLLSLSCAVQYRPTICADGSCSVVISHPSASNGGTSSSPSALLRPSSPSPSFRCPQVSQSFPQTPLPTSPTSMYSSTFGSARIAAVKSTPLGIHAHRTTT